MSWLGTEVHRQFQPTSQATKSFECLTYRRLEPDKERAHGRGVAGDLATSEAGGRAGRDGTKDAALSKSVERGMVRGIAARQSVGDGRRGAEQKGNKRPDHSGETHGVEPKIRAKSLCRLGILGGDNDRCNRAHGSI
jgi:hypothetical protein